MSQYKTQALVQAPIEEIWELVGDPSRHPEWWPRVIEVRGEEFDVGDEYVQVTRSPLGTDTTNFLVEKRQPLREIQLRCQKTGAYARWLMTEAQGGTFMDVEFGMDPLHFTDKLVDRTIGRRFFRRWVDESVDGLREAVKGEAATAGSRREG